MSSSQFKVCWYYIVLRVQKHFQKGTRGSPAHGGIAQLVEHLLCKQGVIGSNPFTSTTEEKVVGEARERMGS